MKIPKPVANHRAAVAYARRWVHRIGETWNTLPVPMRVHSNAHRLLVWAERHLRAPTNRR